MRSRRARLAAVAACSAALVGPSVPAADAATVRTIVFVANVTLSAGQGYPLVTLGPAMPSPACLPLPTVVPNCRLSFDHVRALAVASTVCVGTAVTALSPPKPPAGAGPCAFTGSGTSSGHCGLHSEQVTIDDTTPDGQPITYELHIVGVGETETISGHWWKPNGDTGLVVGMATRLPFAYILAGQNCLTKTAALFTWVGSLTAVGV